MTWSLPKESKEIGGFVFEVEALPVALGREALIRLQRVAGPALAELVQEAGARAAAARAFAELSERLTHAELTWFCQTFAERTVVRWRDEDRELPLSRAMDEVFARRYELLLQWLTFCVEWNFEGFFESAHSWIATVSGSAPNAPASPKSAPEVFRRTSTGKSTG